VHFGECSASEGQPKFGQGRWLVVDETGGLILATMAERMGILYPPEDLDQPSTSTAEDKTALKSLTQSTMRLVVPIFEQRSPHLTP